MKQNKGEKQPDLGLLDLGFWILLIKIFSQLHDSSKNSESYL